MKLGFLKKKLIKDLIFISLTLLSLGILLAFALNAEKGTEQQLARIEREKADIKAKVIGSQKEYDSLVQALETYKSIPRKRLPAADSLDTPASRIRASSPIVEILKKRYYFPSLSTQLSAITQEKLSNIKTITVSSNDIIIDFEGMTDELVFSFISTMIDEFPGYLQLKQLKMNRVSDIAEPVLNSITKDRTLVPLVRGNIVFTWKTLQGSDLGQNKN